MKKIIYLITAALIFLGGCDSKPKKYSRTVYAMDTSMTISIWGDNSEAALSAAVKIINDYDFMFDKENKDSPLYALNRSNGTTTKVPDEIAEQISYARNVYTMSAGALNIALEPIIKAWGFDGSEYRIPSDDEIENILPMTDFSKILQDDNYITMPSTMSISLGATAKGYTAEKICSELQDMGVKSGLIDLGGNIRAIGSKPDGSDWCIAVANPFGSEFSAFVYLSDKSAVTSGDYQRYFERDGIKYHHILDPVTGYPAKSGLASVTIICQDAAYADCLSTALFVMGEDEARKLHAMVGGFEAIFISQDATVTYTDGLQGKIEIPKQ